MRRAEIGDPPCLSGHRVQSGTGCERDGINVTHRGTLDQLAGLNQWLLQSSASFLAGCVLEGNVTIQSMTKVSYEIVRRLAQMRARILTVFLGANFLVALLPATGSWGQRWPWFSTWVDHLNS